MTLKCIDKVRPKRSRPTDNVNAEKLFNIKYFVDNYDNNGIKMAVDAVKRHCVD